jgi:hypothetical protein
LLHQYFLFCSIHQPIMANLRVLMRLKLFNKWKRS